MRFGIRDLLILTTLAVVYAAAFAAMPAREWSKMDLVRLLPALGILAPVFAAISSQRRVGRSELTITPRWAWWAHFGIALTGCCTIPFLTGQASNSASMVIGYLVAFHCVTAIAWRTTLGERGVAVGPQWLPWEQYVFYLQGRRLRFLHRDHLNHTASLKHGQGEAFVSPELLDEVQGILDRHQPLVDDSEGKPANADQDR